MSHLVLFSWPLVVFWLFSRLHPATALSWSIIGGYLFLPSDLRIDFPLLPTVNKNLVPAVTALIAAAILAPRNMRERVVMPGIIPRSSIVALLVTGIIVGSLATAFTNGDRLVYGAKNIGGLRIYDGLSMAMQGTVILLPFLLARKYLAHPEAQAKLLIALVFAGLAYSILAMYEIRFSPQLSRKIYGYFPHEWLQHVRGGGYRPVVFLHHGLWLAIFFTATILAALTAWKARLAPPRRWLIAGIWLTITLILSKSLGALIIAIIVGAILLLASLRLQMVMAAIIGLLVLLYPMLRGADLIPTDRVIAMADKISIKRGSSLEYRIDNEDMLLAKAQQRPVFGWGGWGRSRIYNEAGRDISVADGYWVIVIGTSGWAGYLSEFGLLTIPLMVLAFRQKRHGLNHVSTGVALILAASLIDLLPNATITPVTWLLAGSVAGRLELGRLRTTDSGRINTTLAKDAPANSPYTRQNRRHERKRGAPGQG